MLIPLVILAALSLAGGYLFEIPKFLGTFFPALELPEDFSLTVIASSAGLLGIALAWWMYVAKPGIADSFAGSIKGLYTFVYNKYFVDELYDAAIVKPVVNGSRVLLWKGMDAGFIDGMVNGAGSRARNLGGLLRLMQSGNVRSYATWVLLGSLGVIAVIVGLSGGIR
jgi:NADH-quinone oxidoreductase subunit L